MSTCPTLPGDCSVQTRFMAQIKPRVEAHAGVIFRYLGAARKEDAVAETVAMAWKWYRRLVERGKDVSGFVSTLATYAALAVKNGRRVCGQENAKDVLSPRAQQRYGFIVGKLPDFSSLGSNPLMEALHDNSRSPVPDQVAFRFDFPAWLRSYPRRHRRIIQALAVGERTLDVAGKFGASPGRVSQLRREYQDDWRRFTGEVVDTAGASVPA